MEPIRKGNRIHYVEAPKARLISEIKAVAPEITLTNAELVYDSIEDAVNRNRSFGNRVMSFIAGQSHLSRGIGILLDIGTVFLPFGVRTGREALQVILKRKQRQMPLLTEKKWYQSKTIWGAILVIVTALAQHFGIETQIAYEFLYALAGALGLVGLRHAVSPKVK